MYRPECVCYTNIMKTRYLSIDYLSFRKYPNEIFTLHLTTIPTICIITRLFNLMVIPSDVVETVTSETQTWKFETETRDLTFL